MEEALRRRRPRDMAEHRFPSSACFAPARLLTVCREGREKSRGQGQGHVLGVGTQPAATGLTQSMRSHAAQPPGPGQPQAAGISPVLSLSTSLRELHQGQAWLPRALSYFQKPSVWGEEEEEEAGREEWRRKGGKEEGAPFLRPRNCISHINNVALFEKRKTIEINLNKPLNPKYYLLNIPLK